MRLRYCTLFLLVASAAIAGDRSPAEVRRDERARKYLRTAHLPNIIDAKTQLRLESTLSGVDRTRYQYRQFWKGIFPVTSGVLELESRDDGTVRVTLDRTIANLEVDTGRLVSPDAAQRTAASHLGVTGALKYDSQLFVYPKDRENDHHRLIWVVSVTGDDDDQRLNASVWVDAHSGVVLKSNTGRRHSAAKAHTER
ncbi:MAG TPA: hypothetical protein VGJ82_08385 [Thermoanaerobaculia bacterium]|jgi:hypothetical protein